MTEHGVRDKRHRTRRKGLRTAHALPEDHAVRADKRFHKGRTQGKSFIAPTPTPTAEAPAPAPVVAPVAPAPVTTRAERKAAKAKAHKAEGKAE